MRMKTLFAVIVALAAAATSVQAEQKTQSGKPPACKAPWGEPFGLGETIDLHQTDGKGTIVKVTYQCTENGWVKVLKRALGGQVIHIDPTALQRAL